MSIRKRRVAREKGLEIEWENALYAQAALDRVERAMGPTYPNSAKHLVAARSGIDFAATSRWNAKRSIATRSTRLPTPSATGWSFRDDHLRPAASRLDVSRLCLGAMNFGRLASAAESFEILDHAHSVGINYIDTSNSYSTPDETGI